MLKYLVGSVLLLAAVVLIRLDAFTLSGDEAQQRRLIIEHRGDRLAGTLVVPAGITSPPVVVLVHGDGAQDRWSEGGYLPLVNSLMAQGIAVFSWDKPGTGDSHGNWLAQTMSDRADEAAAVLAQLRSEPALRNNRMGFLGFSQAGWVVPAASEQAHADFAVLIGPAINWREQGFYYLRQRLAMAGESVVNINNAVARETADFDSRFTPDVVHRPCTARCTREDFEQRNALSDARATISTLNVPVMILAGEHDRNVDPLQTVKVWQNALPKNTPRCIQLVDDATHGLLRSRWFDYQLSQQWPWWKQGAFLLAGQEAYAPGVLNTLADWITDRRCAR